MGSIEVTTFELPERFCVTTPASWVRRLDPSILLWLTSPTDPGSGILFAAQDVDWDALQANSELGATAERFLNDSIAPACSGVIHDARSTFWTTQLAASLRTYVEIDDGRTWVFQLVLAFKRREVYLIHWNGPSVFMQEHVIPILDSFDTGGDC